MEAIAVLNEDVAAYCSCPSEEGKNDTLTIITHVLFTQTLPFPLTYHAN